MSDKASGLARRRAHAATLAAAGALVCIAGVSLAWPRAEPPSEPRTRARSEVSAPRLDTTERVELAAGSGAPALAAPTQATEEHDYVAEQMPLLRGLPKQRQLELLKQMALWPGDKLAFQMPAVVENAHLSPAERRAMAEELAGAVMESIEGEGIRYDLPEGFRPTGMPIPPPPPGTYPQPE
jgi:hypothetical protein